MRFVAGDQVDEVQGRMKRTASSEDGSLAGGRATFPYTVATGNQARIRHIEGRNTKGPDNGT